MSDAKRGTQDARFDEAIDRAVREMLDVEPPAELRARVIERIERPVGFTDRVASGFSWKILVPVAAMALIVLAVFVARRSEPVAQAPVVANAVDRYLPPEAARQTVDVPVARTQPAPAVARRAAAEPNTGIVVAAALTADEPETLRIAPLNTMAPISVAPLTRDAIAPADMTVRSLNTITDIQIAPLTPPERR